MNIFIMILVALFMAGYYLMDSPSQHIEQHDTQYAIEMSDLRTVAQCTTSVHNAQINGTEFQDVCITQNGIVSEFICLNEKHKKTSCDGNDTRKKIYRYIVTATAPIPVETHNNMMEILENNYTESGTFGLLDGNAIISGGTSTKRIIPAEIIKNMKLTDGQLIYLTQYERPDIGDAPASPFTDDVICPTGTIKTYRFGRWQCIAHNTKNDCGGDMIWSSDTQECIPDDSRKPLCTGDQIAVVVDDVWECISPFPEKKCPNNLIARLNYNTFEWECVENPSNITDKRKCDKIIIGDVYGAPGTTLRIPRASCTPCEIAVTDYETCVTICMPDAGKITDPNCYPGNPDECRGINRAIYFGFPNYKYVANIPELNSIEIYVGGANSPNRRFNCMDCGDGEIDTERSVYPYTAVCK